MLWLPSAVRTGLRDSPDRLTTYEMAASPGGTVTVRAKGDEANGWPVMQLQVNGMVVEEWTVSSSSWLG